MKISSFLLLSVLFLNTLQAQETGNVGIGTTNPTQKLDVNGSIELPVTINSSTGILGILYKGGSPFLHDFKASSSGSIGQNVFLGKNAGNFTMPGGADYQSSDNTGIGASSLYSNTTGFANTSIGSYAMPTNSTGYRNTAIGVYSLYSNLSGIENTSLGVYSSQHNSTGNNNVAIGFSSNCFNETGSNNTIIGFAAGRGTSLHNKSGNVFIGYAAGYNETGSNKLYIENSNSTTPLIGGDFSLDQVYMNGTVGIGTSSPAASAKLEIAGTDKGFLPPRLTVAQIQAINTPVAGLMVYNTATNKPNYYDGTSWKDFNGNTGLPVIGAFWEGGIVYYIDGTGEHGLISAVSDQSTGAPWGCFLIPMGAYNDGYGAGETNTAIILNSCFEAGIAAKICNDLVLNNQIDWYLPATWELTQIFDSGAGVGGFEAQVYWTSHENTSSGAMGVLYGTPYTTNGYAKSTSHYVRCIRKF